MTMHDTWADVDVHCERCGMHAEDPGHTTSVCGLGFRAPDPQDLRETTPDPLGPSGIHGLGRCDRCGESFTQEALDHDLAEVVPAGVPEGAPLSEHLTIHAGCINETDRLA